VLWGGEELTYSTATFAELTCAVLISGEPTSRERCYEELSCGKLIFGKLISSELIFRELTSAELTCWGSKILLLSR